MTDIAIEAMARPELENKTALGRRVRLTAAERDALNIGTIRPYDQTPAQFERSRREKRRARNRAIQEARRRKAGAMPRDQYLAQSLKSPRPWETKGISRRTYYRKLARETAGTVAQVRHPPSFLLGGDALVPPTSPAAAQQGSGRPAVYSRRGRRPRGRPCAGVGSATGVGRAVGRGMAAGMLGDDRRAAACA